ncbi:MULTISPECIES: response regulator [unclassified Caballeronia]|uniref:response regulator n=1 Tax=unclassified Caballeronia TaxID=2646786 RepID=UPI002858FFD8|nr:MULTISPECIES: response regulator [unclassified Caballeronia]MDR5763085.1 response regulator [Caballeronia sp. LZ035]MDR5883919.1 response regulator [Caballeronia sp. LZ032]
MKPLIWTERRARPRRPLRILVVDDHALGAEAVALALSSAGHEARFAVSGRSALEQIALWTPDVAVLDINMPSPDGFQLAALLRAMELLRDLVLIAYTSMDELAVKSKGIEAGFDGFCQKGMGTAPLLDMIALFAPL